MNGLSSERFVLKISDKNVILPLVNVLEKLVKPLVRKAPEGAFRYLWGNYG